MAALVFSADRHEMLLHSVRRFGRATIIACCLFIALFVAFLILKPFQNADVVRIILPPTRTVVLKKLIPEPPKPAENLAKREELSVAKVPDAVKAPVQAIEPPKVQPPKPVDKVAADAGRARAQAATAALTKATSSLDKALGDLNSSLGAATSGEYKPSRNPRARNTGAGRSDGQLGAVGNGQAGSGAADLGGSAVQGTMVSIGSLAPAAAAEDQAGAEGGAGTGSKPGVYRSNAQLLAVIQKYAAGIQYCYEAELKRDEHLTGKLVVAMTITAAGNVQEATVVRNTLGNDRIASCALSQIRSWKFPPINGGLTTFQAPFVFTPPK